jgi:hypothetical protein
VRGGHGRRGRASFGAVWGSGRGSHVLRRHTSRELGCGRGMLWIEIKDLDLF